MPGVLSTSILPWWASMTFLAKFKPIPKPFTLCTFPVGTRKKLTEYILMMLLFNTYAIILYRNNTASLGPGSLYPDARINRILQTVVQEVQYHLHQIHLVCVYA